MSAEPAVPHGLAIRPRREVLPGPRYRRCQRPRRTSRVLAHRDAPHGGRHGRPAGGAPSCRASPAAGRLPPDGAARARTRRRHSPAPPLLPANARSRPARTPGRRGPGQEDEVCCGRRPGCRLASSPDSRGTTAAGNQRPRVPPARQPDPDRRASRDQGRCQQCRRPGRHRRLARSPPTSRCRPGRHRRLARSPPTSRCRPGLDTTAAGGRHPAAPTPPRQAPDRGPAGNRQRALAGRQQSPDTTFASSQNPDPQAMPRQAPDTGRADSRNRLVPPARQPHQERRASRDQARCRQRRQADPRNRLAPAPATC